MLVSSTRTPERKFTIKRKWNSKDSINKEDKDLASTDIIQTPQYKRVKRTNFHQVDGTPPGRVSSWIDGSSSLGRAASWVKRTAWKTVNAFSSIYERYWRDDVEGEDDAIPTISSEFKDMSTRQREVHSNQRDNEERFSQWRRKPRDESYTLYSQTSENGTFSRKVYDPSKYTNKPVEEHSREEARPFSSFRSRQHREVEVSRKPVFSRHENPVQMKPKPPKLPNSFAYQLKRPSRTVDNVVRLQEREQYMKLLACYTSSSRPQYYDSVNARKTITVDDEDERKSKAASPSKSLHEKPLLKSTNAKSVNFRSSPDRELQKSSTTYRKQPLAMALEEKSKVIPENFSKGIAKVEKTSSCSSRSFDLLNDHWIKKWRETLSAESLEQQRKIAKEKLRLEAIRKEKDDLEIISQQVKDRMFGRQKIEQEKIYALPELTDEMNCVIDKALGHGASNELLVELSIGRITRADIITLRPQAWLNDEVVNAYFHMIAERSKKTGVSVHAFNTFFYPKLIKTGHTSLRRWTKKVDLFSLDIVLIPIHLGMHWCLAVIDLKEKTFTYYDSLKGDNQNCIQALRDYICAESLDKKKTTFDLTGWRNDSPKDIPEQLNGCDCGVFACQYAEYVSRRSSFNFTQHDMPYFRRRMIYEILSKTLL